VTVLWIGWSGVLIPVGARDCFLLHPPLQWVLAFFPRKKSSQGMKLTINIYLVLRLRKVAPTPLSLYIYFSCQIAG